MALRLDTMSQEYREAKNSIYKLAHLVCLNGKEQNSLISAMQETERQMVACGESGKDIILTLNSIIIDGLQYGNWPWIRHHGGHGGRVNTL